MNDYIVSCCSMVDLSNEYLKNIDVCYLGGNFSINGESYVDDMGETISHEKLYEAMLNGAEVGTSLNNTSEFEDYFEKLLEKNMDILHICFSSGLSGIFESAKKAWENISHKYPNRKIYIVDSLAASTGYGMIVDKAAELRSSGKDINFVYSWLEKNKLRLNHIFFTHNLDFYIKGGRVSKLSGTVGKMLGICPLLRFNKDGKIEIFEKIRTKKKAINEVVNIMLKGAKDGVAYSDKCYLCHSNSKEEVQLLLESIKNTFDKINGDIKIFNIGPVIGCHSGPGTVALFFWGDSDRI